MMFRVVVMVWWCDDDNNYNNIIEYYSLVLWKYIFFTRLKYFSTLLREQPKMAKVEKRILSFCCET